MSSFAEFQWLKFSIELLIISILDSDFSYIGDPFPEAGQKRCGLLSCGLLATSRSDGQIDYHVLIELMCAKEAKP